MNTETDRNIFRLFYKTHPGIAISVYVILLLLLCGSIASFFSQKSIPGDFLYAYKIEVREPVRGLFAVTKTQKATVSLTHAKARLRELAILTEKETLEESTAHTLEEAYQHHMTTVRRIAPTLQSNHGEVAEKIYATLLYQDDLYTQLTNKERKPDRHIVYTGNDTNLSQTTTQIDDVQTLLIPTTTNAITVHGDIKNELLIQSYTQIQFGYIRTLMSDVEKILLLTQEHNKKIEGTKATIESFSL